MQSKWILFAIIYNFILQFFFVVFFVLPTWLGHLNMPIAFPLLKGKDPSTSQEVFCVWHKTTSDGEALVLEFWTIWITHFIGIIPRSTLT